MFYARYGKRIFYFTLTLLLLACIAPLHTSAAPSTQLKPSMTVRAGYGDDGSYILGEWFPVWVTLDNPAGAPSGRVRVEVDAIDSNSEIVSLYAKEVDLGSPARKEIVLYAFNYSYGHQVAVRLLQGGALLSTVSANLNPIDGSGGMILGVVSSDHSALGVLSGEKAGHARAVFTPNYGGPSLPQGTNMPGTLQVSHLDLRDLPPNALALSSLGALLFDGVDTRALTAEQRAAIELWVARGGTLIVAASPSSSDATEGLRGLLPVKPGGTRTLTSLRSLSELVNVPLIASGVLVQGATPIEGAPGYARVLALEGGVPLVAVRDMGMGQVVYMALSPNAPPLKGWDGVVPLFKRLLAQHNLGASFAGLRGQVNQPGYGYGQGGIFDLYGDVFGLAALDLPSGWLLSAFILGYIFVVGPLNFIVLRRMRRTELAWITIPALVVLFSIGAYLIGYNSKGGDLIMPRSTVTYMEPDASQASGVQIWGLFSPLRGTYNVSLGANSLVTQLTGWEINNSGSRRVTPHVLGGSTTDLNNIVVDTGSLKGFISENAPASASPLDADLHLGDNLIIGTVRNNSKHGLEDVALVRGDAVQYIGYMAPGKQVSVKLEVLSRPLSTSSPNRVLPPPPGVKPSHLSAYGNAQSPEEREYSRKAVFLSKVLQPVVTNSAPTDWDVLALAWGGPIPVTVDVAGHKARTEDMNLVISHLRVSGGTSGSALFSAPAPFWVYTPAERQFSAGTPAQALKLAPYADLIFQLPPGTRPSALNLNYSLTTAGSLDILAYNVRTGHWDKVGSVQNQSGATGAIPLSTAEDYVGAGGELSVRLLAPATLEMQLDSIGLELNGKQ